RTRSGGQRIEDECHSGIRRRNTCYRLRSDEKGKIEPEIAPHRVEGQRTPKEIHELAGGGCGARKGKSGDHPSHLAPPRLQCCHGMPHRRRVGEIDPCHLDLSSERLELAQLREAAPDHPFVVTAQPLVPLLASREAGGFEKEQADGPLRQRQMPRKKIAWFLQPAGE